MSIKRINMTDLRGYEGREGLILQGCGGDPQEWIDGINDLLTKNEILLDGTKFKNEDCAVFDNNGSTCILYEFTEDTKINMGRLAIANVNSAFGTNISVDEFSSAMSATRNAYINTANYTDPTTKNNLDLVLWAENAADKGWGYVYGTYGTVLDNSLLDSKITQYPEEVGGNEEFIRENWLWKRTADCVGLIKGYSWYDTETQKTLLVSNGMPDIGADVSCLMGHHKES